MNSVMNMASMWWTRPTLKHTALWRIWPFLCWLVTGPETRNLPNTPNTQPFDPTLDREIWPRPGEISSSTVRGTCFNVPRTIPASSFGRWATRAVGVPTSLPAQRPYGVGIPDDQCNMKERNTTEMPCSFVVMGKASGL